jgi:1-acyl-sn-glycerol-3-phosphate acyltransferase
MMGSFLLSLGGVMETLAVSAPTVVDAVRGRITVELCDARLKSWAKKLLDLAEVERVVVHPERAATSEVFVVMSNHRSLYDIPLIFESFPRTLRMVAKTELFRVPIWGRAMREAGFIELDRNNRMRAKQGIEVARARLEQGINVWIAPEGTRTRSGALGPFKGGGFRLALNTGLRILPVGIRGTEKILPADGVMVNRGARVELEFGNPVDPKHFGEGGRIELMNAVRASIQAMV